MHEEAASSAAVIRTVNRNYYQDSRRKHKEFLLGNKRLGLHDISEYLHEVTVSEFKELLSKLKEKPVSLELLRKIKNSCVSHVYIDAVFKENGAFNKLITILIGEDSQKQLEAAACLTNLACGTHRCSCQVAKRSGAYLVSFTNGNSHFLQEQSLWAFANIANDCLECFNIIKAQGVFPTLLKALQSPLSSVIQNAVFALNACTQYEDPQVISSINPSLLKRLLSILEHDNFNKSVFLHAAFTLSNCYFLLAKYSMYDWDVRDVKRILNLLEILTENTEIDVLIATPLMRCIGFSSYDDRICEFLALHPGFFKSMQILSTKENCLHLSKEAFWVLSNVAAAIKIFNMSYFMPIIDSLEVHSKLENSVILQVLYFLTIFASKNEYLCPQLKQHKIFTQIECLLENENKDVLEAVTIFFQIAKQQ